MNSRKTYVVPLIVASLLVASVAVAEEPGAEKAEKPGEKKEEKKEAEGRYPLAEAERPLTLPKMVLMRELDIDVPRVSLPSPIGGQAAATSFANVSVGASFGITDDLTVRAQVLPLQLAGGSGFHYGQTSGFYGVDNPGPGVGATYRFLRGDFEVGGSLDLNLITLSGASGVVITPGVPVRIHVGKSIRIDTGAYLPITRASIDGSGAFGAPSSIGASGTGLVIPASFLYDITEPLHVGVATGFQINDFSDVGNNTAIPLGIFAGYAIGGKDGPVLDIDPFFNFYELFTPGNVAGATNGGAYVFGLSVGGFLYL